MWIYFNTRSLVIVLVCSTVCFFVNADEQVMGSCDFEVTSPETGNNLCGYTHGPIENSDFFNWQLEDDGGGHYMSVKTEEHTSGQKARLYSVEIQQQDTHCYSFQYHIEGGFSGNSSGSSNSLKVYVLDHENMKYELPVWESTPGTYQRGWTTVQLALNPRGYRVVFEAAIAESTPGVIALDNIVVHNKACVSTPHFLRMGNKEVNKGQEVSLQCLLWGHNLTSWEKNQSSSVILQKSTGEEFKPTTEKVFNDHLCVNFLFPNSGLEEQGRYRCVSQNVTSAGVSNFANVSVKTPPIPQRPPEIRTKGSTHLKIRLNSDSYVGDAPIIKTLLDYRPVSGSWSDVHESAKDDYHLWHLKPDTKYEIRVSLVRPGIGGRGAPGPVLTTRTNCGVPLQPVRGVIIRPIASSELKVLWQTPDFSVTQCHYHSYVVKYRKFSSSNSSSPGKFEVKEVEGKDYVVIDGLDPFTMYEVKIELVNSEGSIESAIYESRTGEGVPGPVPVESFLVTHTNETAISLEWDEPKVINGVLMQYDVSFRGTSSHQPDFTPQEDNGLFQVCCSERNVTLIPLHAGTDYSISIRAKTGAGYGPLIGITASTKIAAPKMGVYPPPVPDNGNASTPTTIEVEVLPAQANGAPISHYYIVIQEIPDTPQKPGEVVETPSKPKGSRSNRKRKKNRKRQKRQALYQSRVKRQIVVTTGESDNPCYAEPITYEDAKKENKSFYFGGKLDPKTVNEGVKFMVGEGSSSDGFSNPPLDPNKKYNIYIRVDSKLGNETKVNCALVAIKASMPPTTTVPPTATTTVKSEAPKTTAEPIGNGLGGVGNGDDNTEITESNGAEEIEDSENIVLYGSIGGGVFFILLLIVIIIIIIKMRKGRTKQKDEVVNPFEVRMMMSDMVGTANTHSMARSFGSHDRQALMMPDVVDFENHDFMEKTLDASGTRVTGTFQSGSTPMVEDRPVLRVDDFHIHVNDMKRQNNFGFHEEFSSFREGQTAVWDVGKRDENRNKNRYGNIMAYDHSRVILQPAKGQEEDQESDYINANYIMGYKTPQMYIASQAPSAETIKDFWQMIWQENCPVVIMVTNLVELGKRKCDKYWPDDAALFGTLKVTLTDTEELSDYTIRTFVIQQDGGYDVREVKQFHFTAWPDHGVPDHPTGILAFVRRVKSFEPPGQGPTIVHCSAGCGRTGCFIVIDMMLDMAREEGVIDIYNTVTDLRSRRVNMVQTQEQYMFIHDAVLEALLCGETLVAAQDLRQHYDDLITVDHHTQNAPVQDEFETLSLMTPKLSEEDCAVAKLPRNRHRNRFMDVLPPDRKMPYLVTPHPTDPDSNYINAIFADSYSKKDTFIITQMPLPNTVIDFWRLVYDYNCSSIVMMNDVTEHDQTCSQYWPDSGNAVFGPFTVEIVQKEDEVDVVTRLFKLQNMKRPNEGYRLVQQFQLTNWPATQPVPYTRNAVLRVIQLVTKWQNENSGNGRALIHCVAGAGRSGTFAACYNLCMQLRREAVVDVFNIVQRLRNLRPQLVETLEQYRFCYEVGWDFADQ